MTRERARKPKERHFVTVHERMPREHHCGGAHTLFEPTCTCGWEGAFRIKREEAVADGADHKRIEART